MLGLPYALAQGGFIGGMLVLLVGAFFAYLSAQYIGILFYLDGRNVPISSIIELRIGKVFGFLVLAGTMFSAYGAMVAYPLAIGELLYSLANIPFGIGSLGFLIVLIAILSRDLGDSSNINTVVTSILVILLIWVIAKAFPHIEPLNLLSFHPTNMPFAVGVVIFAFSGHLVIPSVLHYVGADISTGLKVINWGLGSVALLYALFFLITLGVVGGKVTSVATVALGQSLSPAVAIVGQVFTIMAIFTSAFGVGISLKLIFENQFRLKPFYSLALIAIPVVLIDVYLSLASGDVFVQVLNYAGGIGSALYAGFVPAVTALSLSRIYKLPYGTYGAYAAVIFYGLAILLTVFS